jgi:hypothetical protein
VSACLRCTKAVHVAFVVYVRERGLEVRVECVGKRAKGVDGVCGWERRGWGFGA